MADFPQIGSLSEHDPGGQGHVGGGDHARDRQRDGMPDKHHFHKEAGLRVMLRRIPKLTKSDLLLRPFYFQNAPTDSFGWDKSHAWEDYVTIGKGTFTREGGEELKTISLSSLVVDYNPTWAVLVGGKKRGRKRNERAPGGNAPNIIQVGDYLEKLLDGGTAMRLVVWNRALYEKAEIDMAVTLRSVSFREQGGEPDARYFDLAFSQYREPRMKRRGYGKDSRRDLPAHVIIQRNGTAEVQERGKDGVKNPEVIGTGGNPATLRRLAKVFYGAHGMWRTIAKVNGITNYGPDENLAGLAKRGRAKARLVIPEAKDQQESQHDHGGKHDTGGHDGKSR